MNSQDFPIKKRPLQKSGYFQQEFRNNRPYNSRPPHKKFSARDDRNNWRSDQFRDGNRPLIRQGNHFLDNDMPNLKVQIHPIGKKVKDPVIHVCETCSLPIRSYGRMIPCKHVFCFSCAKKTETNCPRCKDVVQRIEQCLLGSVWLCTYSENCKRTYLSQRDLQAHINHRHSKEQQAGSNQNNASKIAAPSAMQQPPMSGTQTSLSGVPPASLMTGVMPPPPHIGNQPSTMNCGPPPPLGGMQQQLGQLAMNAGPPPVGPPPQMNGILGQAPPLQQPLSQSSMNGNQSPMNMQPPMTGQQAINQNQLSLNQLNQMSMGGSGQALMAPPPLMSTPPTSLNGPPPMTCAPPPISGPPPPLNVQMPSRFMMGGGAHQSATVVSSSMQVNHPPPPISTSQGPPPPLPQHMGQRPPPSSNLITIQIQDAHRNRNAGPPPPLGAPPPPFLHNSGPPPQTTNLLPNQPPPQQHFAPSNSQGRPASNNAMQMQQQHSHIRY